MTVHDKTSTYTPIRLAALTDVGVSNERYSLNSYMLDRPGRRGRCVLTRNRRPSVD
jgi:hypothetical protein